MRKPGEPGDDRMKILHVIPGFANASGPTQVVGEMTAELARRGNEVTLLYTSGRGRDNVIPGPEGVRVKVFPCHGLKNWAYAPELGRWLRKHAASFDVVHVHSLWCYTNMAVYRHCSRKHIPVVIRPAGTLTNWAMGVRSIKKRLYLNLVEKKHIESAAALQLMSKREADDMKGLGLHVDHFVLPNGMAFPVPPSHSPEKVRDQVGIPSDARVVLSLGRLHPVKNLDFLGRVFRETLRKEPGAFLVIAGPDQHGYADRLKACYAELGIQDHVVFAGEVKGADKWSLYGAADVFVLASTSENFGNVVLEALWSGLPVLASQGTPWEELTSQDAGFWLPLDEAAFAEKLVEVLADRQRAEAMGRAARAWAQQAFSWSGIADRLEEHYRAVCNER